ncbi:hypothetical protein RJ639_028954 [Escallonia herrerae]|uniref:Uncharacterized protein n=1 Tax=Escallonia herrerae TaxID=1293975 RepID=A0AA88XBR1_9ASTE|nr:hypothetical protein RJ639_028954 [Escallonia herrerae]
MVTAAATIPTTALMISSTLVLLPLNSVLPFSSSVFPVKYRINKTRRTRKATAKPTFPIDEVSLLSRACRVTYCGDRYDKEDSNKDATTIIPAFFWSVLFHAKTKRKSSTNHEDENGWILQSFPNKFEETLRRRLLICIFSKGLLSS